MSDPVIDTEILYQHEPHWRRQGWTGVRIVSNVAGGIDAPRETGTRRMPG